VEKTPLTILKYGESILKKQACSVTAFDERLLELIQKMIQTMHLAPGVGLAAPQVGEPLQLATVDTSIGQDASELLVLINPRLIESDPACLTEEEGCLSLPGYALPVERHARIVVSAIDLEGREAVHEFRDFKARVVQHEIDHLSGTLIIDRVSNLKRALIKQEIKRLAKSGKW